MRNKNSTIQIFNKWYKESTTSVKRRPNLIGLHDTQYERVCKKYYNEFKQSFT